MLLDAPNDLDPERTAVYLRRSTHDQEEKHQREDIATWLQNHDLRIGDVDVYSDSGSGAEANREDFIDLQNAIEADNYDALVVWELSRLAREPTIAESFFSTCESHGVDIHITDGLLPYLPSEYGLIRAFASFGVHMAKQERERLISRTESGMRRARQEGKWIGQVPAGFTRVDGYLRPNLSPDYDESEVGFHDIADALEAIEAGQSYRQAAAETPNVTRPTLMNIYKDKSRRAWYLDGDADDDRVQDALDTVN